MQVYSDSEGKAESENHEIAFQSFCEMQSIIKDWRVGDNQTRPHSFLEAACAGGGLSAGLRDLGRIGLLMLNQGEINGHQLFPKKVVEKIRAGGDKKTFAKAGYKTLEGGSYHSMWWILHNKHGAFAARSVHGQTIYVDPTAEMVIVRFASFPTAKNAQIDPTSLPAYQAVAE